MPDNSKTPMKDIVVILPGIMGSVLQKDGTDLWNVSGQAIWQVLRTLGDRINDLKLEKDDPEGGDIGDGIVATSLIQDAHVISGLWKIDGYTETAKTITDNFDVIKGDIYNDSDDVAANFYQFPYDWRRYNSANAHILKNLLDKRLQAWRNSHEDRKDAKVILLAHSMGGLVARYYLEVLGGWRDCGALFTFGTPYRGSVKAVNFLTNGYRQLFLNLTDIVRSFHSIYELMSIYEMLKIEDKYFRVTEAPVGLPNIDKERAENALKFHQKIEAAIKINSQEADYSYITVPIVGIEQKTFQSAIFKADKIEVVEDLPDFIAHRPDFIGGDGTVAEISASPPEFKKAQKFLIRSVAESHGALQNQDWILDDIQQILENYQFDNKEVRGKERNAGKKAIALLLEDVYFTDEPVVIKAQEIGISVSNKLTAEIFNLTTKKTLKKDFARTGKKAWELQIERLPAGLYRITVTAESSDNNPVTPVSDLFEVGGLKKDVVDKTLRLTESLVKPTAEELNAVAPSWRNLKHKSRSGIPVATMIPEVTGYVLLAACRPSELAYEDVFDRDESNGALTYWLLDTLKQPSPSITYKTIHDRINGKINTQFPTQNPMILGDGNLVFLGDSYNTTPFAVNVKQVQSQGDRTKIKLEAGQAHGLRKGAEFAIYPSGTSDFTNAEMRLAVARVDERGATESWADVTTLIKKEPAIEVGSQAVLSAVPVKLLKKVSLLRDENTPAGGEAALQAIETAIQNNGWVRLLEEDDASTADYQVDVKALDAEGSKTYKLSEGDIIYEICDRAGNPIILRPAIAVNESETDSMEVHDTRIPDKLPEVEIVVRDLQINRLPSRLRKRLISSLTKHAD